MFEKLCAMVAEIMNFDPSDVTENTPLRARDGLSDLDFARLVIAAEQRFGITIYDVDAAAFYYLRDMREYLAGAMKEEGKARSDEESPIDAQEYFYSE